ncbi:MAG: class I SAM-dependent methyltransferase [Candidatus Sericytochromatia bacterium]|nr:class I SAM-dependent methyltransferase [Candidatus Sericytochromatia bacterium]
MKDWLAVAWIALWMPVHTASLWLRDAQYYRHWTLLRVDLAMARAYWWRDPYFLARREGAGIDVPPETLTYGTTPWATAAALLRAVEAKAGERFLELGAGQGRMAFFARIHAGLTVDAYELLPTFVRVADTIRQHLRVDRVTFHQANLLTADLTHTDIVYLAGTCLDDATLGALETKLAWLKPGARVISLSFPLEAPGLEIIGQVPIAVSWGNSTAYLHRMAVRSESAQPE